MKWARRFALLAAVALLGISPAAQQTAQPQNPPPPAPASSDPPPAGGAQSDAPQDPDQPPSGQPIFRAGVNFVRVDAIVTDRAGKPVGDLKPEDFEVTEGGRRQQIETFKLVSLDGGLMSVTPPREIRSDIDEESEAARDDVRLFAVFLDDYHVTRENSIKGRQQLSRFVQTQLGPSDMIGLMMPLEPLASVRHTRNHAAVLRALGTFEGRKYDYTPRNPSEERWMALASAEDIERMRNEITFGAIRGLIQRMGGLKEGRKSLVLLSEGYSNTLPPQVRDPVAGAPGFLNPLKDDPNAGDHPAEFRREAFSGMDMQQDLRDIYDLANRNNVSIYPIDPRGLGAIEFNVDRDANVSTKTDSRFVATTVDTLRVLAENSDGRAIVNQNDLLSGMKQIVVDSSFYYLLGYASTVGKPDGKFHEIDVKVKRPGLQLRHRRGYWALRPEDAARLNAPARSTTPSPVESAMSANATPRARQVRTWLGTGRGENGKTRLTFVWEPIVPPPGQAAREADRPARVVVAAMSSDGAPIFKGTAAPPSAGGATAGPAHVSFDAPPGRLQLRFSVEGARADVLDTEIREMNVPDLTGPQLIMATPEVYRARTLPELQRMKQDPAAVPTASREFSRTERLFIRAGAYAAGGATPAVTARLLNRAGQAIATLPVTPATGASTVPTIELGLSNLPPGDYGLEIKAAADASEAKEVIAFRVTS